MNKKQLIKRIEECRDTILVVINGSDMVEFERDINDVINPNEYFDDVDIINPESIIDGDDDLPYRCSRFNEQYTPEEIREHEFYLLHHNTRYNQENQDAVFCI